MLELFLLLVVVVEGAAIAALHSNFGALRARILRLESAGLALQQWPQRWPRSSPQQWAPQQWAPQQWAPQQWAPPEGAASPRPIGVGPAAEQLDLPFGAPVQVPAPVEGLAADDGDDVDDALGDAAAPAQAQPESAPTEKAAPIDWERWLGVRGAAAVGAVLLVIALLYFLRYSIDAGWLTIAMRVELGAGLSLAVLVGSRVRLPRTHRVLASWMTGAGIAGLYASAWAGAWLAHLYGPVTAFVMGVAITGLAIGLALQASSLPIALLGFVGAFAAPLALISGSESVAAVIVYVVMLDVGAVILAMKKRWWSLALLSVVVSAGYEAVFFATEASDARLSLHFGIAIAFAALFGLAPAIVAPREDATDEQVPRRVVRAVMYAALLASFGLAAPLATKLPLGLSGGPVVGLLVVLVLASVGLAKRQREPGLAVLGALASTAVLFAWALAAAPTSSALVALAISAVALAAPHAVLVGAAALDEERANDPSRPEPHTAVAALFFAALGGGAVLAVAAFLRPGGVLPAVAAMAALSALVAWAARRSRDTSLAVASSAGFVVGAGVLALARFQEPVAPLGAAVIGVVVPAFLARAAAHRGAKEDAEVLAVGARVGAVIALVAIAPHAGHLDFGAFSVAVSALAAVLLLARPAGRGESTVALGPMVGGLLLARALLTGERADAGPLRLLGAGLAAAIVFGPTLVGRALREPTPRLVPTAQAAALVAFATVFVAAPGALDGDFSFTISMTLLGVAVISAGLFALHASRGDATVTLEASRSLALVSAVAMLGAAGLGATREHASVALALVGAGIFLARRWVQHDALVALGAGAIVLSALGVAPNPLALGFHPRAGIPILNWTLVVWGVPSLAAVYALATVAKVVEEDATLGPARTATAVAAFSLLFAWINVMVLDVFGTGAELSLGAASTRSRELRDLVMSGAWAAFGVGLLIVGMRRGSSALRKVSLGVVLLTMAKVFLYDLSALENLYRVAALVGLALSLIGISVLYQRFVFRAARPGASPGAK